MFWMRQINVIVLVLSSCTLCSVAPAAEQVRTKKQWIAMIDVPTGGMTSPETGTFTRSSSSSVVTCTREKWIKDAFIAVAEVMQDRFQFLYSKDRTLCREISLRDDRIGLVTSIHQSAADGVRDLQSLDLMGRASGLNLATLPPRMARGNLQEFLANAELPLVGFLTIDSMLSTYDAARPLMTLFCPFSSETDDIDPKDATNRVARQSEFVRSKQAAWCRAPLVSAMELLAARDGYSKNLTAVVAEIEEHRQMELQEFGYDDLDGVGVGARTSAGFKYRLDPTDEVPSAEILAEFARNVINAEQQGEHGTGVVTYLRNGDENTPRTLRPYLKSAPVPRPSKKAAVRTVVGETFHDIVIKESNDVLIVLDAPWCEACPRILSELKATAASLRKSKAEGIEVVRLDITVNDAPKSYRVDEIPTIYWAPLESKNTPEKYDGDHTVRGFQSFLCQKRNAAGRPLPDSLGCSAMNSASDKREL